MPVDKSTIVTHVRINPAVFKDPESFTLNHDMRVRAFTRTSTPKFGSPNKHLILNILTFGGLKVTLKPSPRPSRTIMVIEFNPGVCLYGHNGRPTSVCEFLDALALVRATLTPFLADPTDRDDLIPGLRPNSPAYWRYIEIPLHCQDPTGDILKTLRHAWHPAIHRQPRHWEDSMSLPGCNLQISIYRKAVEMAAGGKLSARELEQFKHVLRLECRMHEKMLIRYFDNGSNIITIDGKERLAWFRPADLVKAHRTIFSELQGIFRSGARLESIGPKEKLKPIGHLLATIASDNRCFCPFDQLLHQVRRYLSVPDNTASNIRRAGLAFLEAKSALDRERLLSDSAYHAQPSVINERLEQRICHDGSAVQPGPLITEFYGSEHSHLPRTEFPTYIR